MGLLRTCQQRVMATLYGPLMARYDRFIAPYKEDLFRQVRGRVLEIGPGPGGNLRYLNSVPTWVGLEPNPYMHRAIREQLSSTGNQGEILEQPAENMPYDKDDFDFVISTLVLCSVSHPLRVLDEIARVLRPGGRFLFIEHVAAAKGTGLRILQHALAPGFRICGDGCCPHRETGDWIRRSRFSKVEFQEFHAPATALPWVISPHIAGFAEVS
ncbi:MAG: class I SAM-dependent methyltransferase [Planctomycetota bacterium]|nr:class I SAM-dependent methyltransferase [Planctomycetota bacterium]